MKSIRKIWLGVGAFVVAGTGAIGSRAADAPLAEGRQSSALPPGVAAKLVTDTRHSACFVRQFRAGATWGPWSGSEPGTK